MLANALEAVKSAIRRLKLRQLPHSELEKILGALQAAIAEGVQIERPACFIPNDLSQCGPDTVVNCSHSDFALTLPAGFAIEASSAGQMSFAKPYYIDPTGGRRRCAGLDGASSCKDKRSFSFDLAFVGHVGHPPAQSEIDSRSDSAPLRYVLLDQLRANRAVFGGYSLHVIENPHHFFTDSLTAEERVKHNDRVGYVASMKDARFALCPRGRGRNSIRFFEAIACTTVPIYIGDRSTQFPLDWLIDWNSLAMRIDAEEVWEGRALQSLRRVLEMTEAEHTPRRHYAFRCYWQFLAPEQKSVFEMLVLLEASRRLGGGFRCPLADP